VVGCAGVVLVVDEVDHRLMRVQLDGRHAWSARSADGTPLSPGARVRVRSRDRSTLLVVVDTEQRN
jgi:membrane protein implicated in regulation of membrane protease activity